MSKSEFRKDLDRVQDSRWSKQWCLSLKLEVRDALVKHCERYTRAFGMQKLLPRNEIESIIDMTAGELLGDDRLDGAMRDKVNRDVYWQALHRVLDELRRLSRDQHRNRSIEGQDFIDPSAEDPSDLSDELKTELMKALSKLTDRQRHVFVYRVDSEMPFRDIGAKLGITENAAKKAFDAALSRLRSDVSLRAYAALRIAS